MPPKNNTKHLVRSKWWFDFIITVGSTYHVANFLIQLPLLCEETGAVFFEGFEILWDDWEGKHVDSVLYYRDHQVHISVLQISTHLYKLLILPGGFIKSRLERLHFYICVDGLCFLFKPEAKCEDEWDAADLLYLAVQWGEEAVDAWFTYPPL